MAEQRAIEYQSTEQQILQEIQQINKDAQVAWRNKKIANELLIAAKQVLDSTHRLYQNGAADILELNQSIVSFMQAKQEENDAIANCLRARLKLAIFFNI